MKVKELKKLKYKMQKIAFKRFNAESLTRILLCCLREEMNCKPYDSEVIAEI